MVTELDREDKEYARKVFRGEIDGQTACHFCAGIHASVAKLRPHMQPCPRIKNVERHVDGTVLKLEFWPPKTWEHDVIFPKDVFDEDDGNE